MKTIKAYFWANLEGLSLSSYGFGEDTTRLGKVNLKVLDVEVGHQGRDYKECWRDALVALVADELRLTCADDPDKRKISRACFNITASPNTFEEAFLTVIDPAPRGGRRLTKYRLAEPMFAYGSYVGFGDEFRFTVLFSKISEVRQTPLPARHAANAEVGAYAHGAAPISPAGWAR